MDEKELHVNFSDGNNIYIFSFLLSKLKNKKIVSSSRSA